jgi:LuxR family transcriptional regulator, maltose regulon positive regulatory protein
MSTVARTPSPEQPIAASAGEGRPARAGLVRRDRLISGFAATRDTPVLALVAPAGYGKTTALADWAEHDERASAWLTLDDRHNDPALLLGAIASLLDRIEPIDEEVFAPLATTRAGVSSAVVPRLCAVLRERREPFVLVLDDLDSIENPECFEPLAKVAQAIPVGSQLAVASRVEPRLPIGRMRANRLLAEVGAEDLVMTTREASRVLAACGVRVGLDSVRRLVERTEGWPAGIYLAALSLSRTPKAEAALADFHGDDRLVVDYLRDVFLSDLDRETLDFLIRTSILDRLSGELCDAVLERQGSAELLRRLVRSNLLVVPLDGRDRTYRYHALLREMLLSELLRADAAVASGLHARASAWYRDHGDIDRAVSHAIDSGDRELAGELIWANSAVHESSGRHATVRGWLANFSDAQLAESPRLCLARATGHLAEGDGGAVERWTAVALERLEASGPGYDAGESLALAARIIRASGAARDGVVAMGADVGAAFPSLPSDSPWRPLCRLIEGASLHLTSDREGARRVLEDGARMGAAAMPSIQALCRTQLALIALDEGDLGEAERLVGLAVSETDHYGLGDYPTQALVFAVSALVGARRGRSDAASADAKTSVRLLSGLTELSPWYEAETRITLARALLLLDDGLAARTHLTDAARYLRNAEDATVLHEWLDRAAAEVEAAGSVGGRWPLTPAELRLLHALPTHLSFREIADRQFVSPNTVKTQARSIYRKLGVSSRAEAVACARAAGLLDADPEDSPERGDA